ncbi:unnamed protein product [Pleuronectes platessa]|uniref:Uncharacterized protein n=1 Tax=Pleuronectes platessa TaxID=8262 RepID=A0A9N7UG75_PLEPL|nr:unnamed protein product [Pleuronectes platessa]
MQPIRSQTDLTLTPHVKTSVTEEGEEEKLPEDTVDVALTQNTEEEMQPISNQTDPTIDLLQEEKNSEIFQGYGGKESIAFKIKLKKKRKRKPAQTQPVADLSHRGGGEELPEDTVDVASAWNTEEEMQPISCQTDPTPHLTTSVTEKEVEKLYEDTVDAVSLQNADEEIQPINNQTDLTLTPHVKISVIEEEMEKLSEVSVDVASTQNTEEEIQQISEQSDSTIDIDEEVPNIWLYLT